MRGDRLVADRGQRDEQLGALVGEDAPCLGVERLFAEKDAHFANGRVDDVPGVAWLGEPLVLRPT